MNGWTMPVGNLSAKEIEALEMASGEALAGKSLFNKSVYVVYADVLGFRKKIQTDAANLYQSFQILALQVHTWILSRVGYSKSEASRMGLSSNIAGLDCLNPPIIFSDSIIIISHDDSMRALNQICHASNALFHASMDQRLPLRGAISRGVVWSNESIQVRMGPGITAAYDLAESLDVLGIALDPNLGEPKLSVGPFHFPLKNGGRTLLRIPVQGAEVGIASHLNTDLAKILDEMQANLPENDPMLAARYRNSQQIVQGMAYMGFQHVND